MIEGVLLVHYASRVFEEVGDRQATQIFIRVMIGILIDVIAIEITAVEGLGGV